MKVEFKYNNNHYLEFKNINFFFGGTSSGKTALSELFSKAFNGQSKDFMIDHQYVSKNQYDVIYINGATNLSDEIKLSSKTLLIRILKEIISSQNEPLVNKIKQNIAYEMQPIIDEIQKRIPFYDEQPVFYIDDFIKLLKSFYPFFNEFDINSSSSSRFFTLNLLQALEKNDKEKIIIIDDFDLYLDLSQMLYLIDKFNQLNEYTFILFIRSMELCSILMEQFSIFLLNNNFQLLKSYFSSLVHSINNLNQIDYYPLITDDEIHKLDYSLKTYYLREILTILSCKYPDYIIQNLEKNSFYSPEFIEILKKI